MMDYRQAAIAENEELLVSLHVIVGYLNLLDNVLPRGAKPLIEKDLAEQRVKMNERIERAMARKKNFEEE